MQYTPHYNLNLPEGTDIVNPLVQDNPNYTAIDTALYNNKLRVVGSATHVRTGTNHAITLGDSDINQFKFVATGDYVTGDTFTVDGVTVTPRIADGSSIPNGAFKINSTVLCILDGTILNLIGVAGAVDASDIEYDNSTSGLSANNVQSAIDEVNLNKYTLIGDLGNPTTETTVTISDNMSNYKYLMFIIEQESGGQTIIAYGTLFIPRALFAQGVRYSIIGNSTSGNATVEYINDTNIKVKRDLGYFPVRVYGIG